MISFKRLLLTGLLLGSMSFEMNAMQEPAVQPEHQNPNNLHQMVRRELSRGQRLARRIRSQHLRQARTGLSLKKKILVTTATITAMVALGYVYSQYPDAINTAASNSFSGLKSMCSNLYGWATMPAATNTTALKAIQIGLTDPEKLQHLDCVSSSVIANIGEAVENSWSYYKPWTWGATNHTKIAAQLNQNETIQRICYMGLKRIQGCVTTMFGKNIPAIIQPLRTFNVSDALQRACEIDCIKHIANVALAP